MIFEGLNLVFLFEFILGIRGLTVLQKGKPLKQLILQVLQELPQIFDQIKFQNLEILQLTSQNKSLNMDIQLSTLIDSFLKLQEEAKVIYLHKNELTVAKGNICLHNYLGNNINVIWDISKGNMLILPSKSIKTLYQKHQQYQIIKGVQFRHAHICPFHQPQFTKSQKFYKPCACVLIMRQQDSHVLVTRRKMSLKSFPGAWVLPGGHLQKNQGILQGGLRQAQEQVGLCTKTAQILLDHGVMAWQSAYHVNNQIVSSNIVIFFTIKTPEYQVKPQESEIEEFIWKDGKDYSGEHKYTSVKKDGYGEAHLNYFSFYRNKNYQLEETKPWIKQEKAIGYNNKEQNE